MKNKNVMYSELATVIGALLLLITLILPFASANEDRREKLMNHPDSVYSEEANMTNKEVVNISLIEFIKIDSAAIETGVSEETVIANMIVIIAFIVFAVLTLLFSILKKPIPILIFDIISFAVMQLIKFDFKDRGIIPSSSYDWGIASIICYIGIVVVAVGAVFLLIGKIKNKRSAITSEQNI